MLLKLTGNHTYTCLGSNDYYQDHDDLSKQSYSLSHTPSKRWVWMGLDIPSQMFHFPLKKGSMQREYLSYIHLNVMLREVCNCRPIFSFIWQKLIFQRRICVQGLLAYDWFFVSPEAQKIWMFPWLLHQCSRGRSLISENPTRIHFMHDAAQNQPKRSLWCNSP